MAALSTKLRHRRCLSHCSKCGDHERLSRFLNRSRLANQLERLPGVRKMVPAGGGRMDARRETASHSRAEPHTFNSRVEPYAVSGALLTTVGRIRCFVEPARSRAIPHIEGIDYTVDAEDDFDIFIAPSSQNGSFADFIARCGSPAAPMIGFADRPHPRADILVKEPNGSSFVAAISSLEPLLKKTASLPSLPRGMDRNGLLALALMYTRNCRLSARWQPNDPTNRSVKSPNPFGSGIRRPKSSRP
jgi:hypothetical protein